MSDSVEHPSHYNAGNVETIEGIRAALGDGFSDYCLGNVLKYVWRCKHKGKLLEDLRKAAKYLAWAIEAAESNSPVIPDSSRAKSLAIPEGWRELEARETPIASDMYEREGRWLVRGGDSSVEYEWYDVRHIRKIETANSSETPNSSIPDPGPGYRLLSKEPPEQVISGDEFWQNFNSEWVESENFIHEGGPQAPELYYRRKIEAAS